MAVLALAVQGLTGSLGMVAFTYFLPYLFHSLLSPQPLSRGRKAWAAFNIVIGVLIMLAGLGSSVIDLLGAAGGLFAGTCQLEYSYSPQSPLDPCNISGLPPSALDG